MSTTPNLTEIDSLADGDLFYVWDASDPGNPDKKIPRSKMRPTGAKVTAYIQFAGNVTVPALAAGIEADVNVAVAGAIVGDHLQFNLSVALPANLVISHAWISAADTMTVRFRNLHASVAYAGAALAATALVTRTTA